jgi:hypothetical protein
MRILRKFLNENEIEIGRKCFEDNGILDYESMDNFVKQCLFKIYPGARSMKYRASDNSNSSDAGHFHRDVCNYDLKHIPKIYTVLFYLDEAEMEIIPESDKYPAMSLLQGLRQKSVICRMKPGDVLIFNSCTLHKGRFAKGISGHRRLIQVFDTTFGAMDYTDKVVHLPCIGMCKKHNFSKMSDFVARSRIFGFMNKVTYINTSTGYGIKYNPLKNTEYTMISQEAGAMRYTSDKKYDRNNLYRVLIKKINDVDEKQWYETHEVIHEKSIKEYMTNTFVLLVLVSILYRKVRI